MKEVTMVATCEITSIAVLDDEDVILLEHPDFENQLRKSIKGGAALDDVRILKNQFFIRDLPNESEVVMGTK